MDDMTEEAEQTQMVTPKVRQSLRLSQWIIEDLERSLKHLPDDSEKHYGLSLIALMRGNFKLAIAHLEKSVSVCPTNADALYLLGNLNFKLGDYESAAKALEEVVKLDPDNLTAIIWLTLAYHSLNKRGKAIHKQSILQTVAPDLMVSIMK
jgi:tetratricopeptide (TPR) repeat protein